MKFKTVHSAALSLAFALAAVATSGGALAADDPAVTALMKKSDCTKCHAVDKEKKGPAYKKVAAKYKGKADAVDTLTKSITSGAKVKMSDGSEEDHKIIATKDPKEIKNVVQWILAQ